MTYKFNERSIVIPDKEINNLMSSLELSKQDAIDLWLSDNGYEINEEQEKLDETAKKVHINKDINIKKSTKERKKPEIKVSDEKKDLFSTILNILNEKYINNVTILNENKLISVKINDKTFKIDLIQCRPPKK